MYCKKCGKFIDGEEDICNECLSKELTCGDNHCEAEADCSTRMLGFGGALASAITGVIGILFASCSYIFTLLKAIVTNPEIANGTIASMDPETVNYLMEIKDAILSLTPAAVVLAVFAAIACVPALVFGIKSIAAFRKVNNGKKPVATLVLGIVGIVTAASALIMLFSAAFLAYAVSLL